ncbi:hypothetical protein Hamer_G015302 [Homarus americanus]|uniref:Uncharacterized protein n=1 Tax=Homarus americanus TaxID=6706 RepID=A0A8J5TII6_HOMAM|nr:hypothetical protein Hamer_G015302 [Homarus americanus]
MKEECMHYSGVRERTEWVFETDLKAMLNEEECSRDGALKGEECLKVKDCLKERVLNGEVLEGECLKESA